MQRRILFEKNASDIYQNHKLTLQKEKGRQLTRQRLIHFCLIPPPHPTPPQAHSHLPIQPWDDLSLTMAALFSKLFTILNKIWEKNVYSYFHLLLMVSEAQFILLRYWKSNLKHFITNKWNLSPDSLQATNRFHLHIFAEQFYHE